MDWEFWLPPIILATSLIPGVIILGLPEEQQRVRVALNILGAVAKPVVLVVMVWGIANGLTYETRAPFIPGLDIVLRIDAKSLLFAGLSATLWLLTTVYAVGYLEESPNRSRFFGFFSLCVTATMGIALAGNLITFVLFYELLTVVTYPMVVHRGTPESLAAGRIYLVYTLSGGVVLLIGVVWLHVLAGPIDFAARDALTHLTTTHRWQLMGIFGLLIGGLGVKAALVPLHGWLPIAMVAPAPVSALLHAVAVVKAGVFGILRVVYDVYGPELVAALDVLPPLAAVASFTIIFGSLRALAQDEIKRRLAFSTISQLSYITLGAALVGPLAATGAFVHLVHQGIMKVTLFYCAGNLAETLNIRTVSGMNGVGRRMPVTMAAFTVASLGMIGLPPMAGFVTKWYLGLGSLNAGEPWVLVVLAVSSLLNAIYFLPPIYAAWFKPPDSPWSELRSPKPLEASWMLLVPPVVTAVLAFSMGLLAGVPFSPIDLAEDVIREIFPR